MKKELESLIDAGEIHIQDFRGSHHCSVSVYTYQTRGQDNNNWEL